jgi:hypothetical protein
MISRVRALISLLLLAGAARAESPVLEVRARTRIDLEAIQRVPGGILVRGALMDAGLDEPIPGRPVALDASGPNGWFHQIAEPTHADGRFRWKVPAPIGQITIRLASMAGDHYESPPRIERTIDVGKKTPVLTLEGPQSVSIGESQIALAIEAQEPDDFDETAPPRPADLGVSLSLDGRVLRQLRTRGGRVEVSLPLKELGAPRDTPFVLTARFAGDEMRNSAEATRSLKLVAPTTLSLAASSESLPWRGSVTLSGALSDLAGPIAGAAIAIHQTDDDSPLATATTGSDGHFSVELRGGSLRPGVRYLEARYQPMASYRESSRSTPVTIEVLQPAPRPFAYWLPPLLLAAVLLAIALGRKKPWRPALAKVRERRRVRAEAAGVTESRPRLLSSLRPPTDRGISGVVIELGANRALPTAVVEVTAGEVARAAAVDENGGFAFEELPPGPVTVVVQAPGFVAEKFARALPHRGELRGLRVRLTPLREKIFEAYQKVAIPLMPDPQLAATWTPRELLRHVETRLFLVDELATLTALVEVAYFGPRLPDGTVLAEVQRLALSVAQRTAPSV